MKIIETDRLILRTWQKDDVAEYYRINQDPKVIEYLPGSLSMEQVSEFMETMNQQWEKNKFTLWAAEEKTSRKLIGFIGLSVLPLENLFGYSVEIGWRLDSEYWGKGYATEGAIAARDYGFRECSLDEIVAITVPENKRSQRVMEKIGMERDFACDFAHPRLPPDHRLSGHILFRIKK